MIKLIRLICLLSLLAVALTPHGMVLAGFDAEMDSLADMFAARLSSVNQKLGVADGPAGALAQSEADIKMQKLYKNLENIFIEARQRSANQRSAIISTSLVV